MIRIGHASIDENGKIAGGEAGDQNGKEVKISSWYNKPFSYILRPVDIIMAEKMARACESLCQNDCVGYNQNKRNTLHTCLRAYGYNYPMFKVPCETDCSAFMTVCAIIGGADKLEYPASGNAPATSTMKTAFMKTNKFYYIDNSQIVHTDKHVCRGDILVKPGSHTVMVLDNGKYYNELFVGTKGPNVVTLQSRLAAKGYTVGDIDGDFGKQTYIAVAEFQSDNGLVVDGIVGPKTWEKLK